VKLLLFHIFHKEVEVSSPLSTIEVYLLRVPELSCQFRTSFFDVLRVVKF